MGIKEQIIAMHLQYKSRSEIAKQLNTTVGTVDSAIKSYYKKNFFAKPKPKPKPKLKPKPKADLLLKNIANIKKMAKNHCTLKEIANFYKVSDATVCIFLQKHKIKIKRKNVLQTELAKKVKNLQQKKYKLTPIAKKLNVNVYKVDYILKQLRVFRDIKLNQPKINIKYKQKQPKILQKETINLLKKGLRNDS